MRSLFSVTLLLLLALTLSAEASRRPKNHRGGKTRPASDCSAADTQYGKCVPDKADCGEGLREVTCDARTEKIHCKIPCNWKKDISDCKYKFGPWGPCDAATKTKTRSGALKKALFNADCQSSVKVSKPCTPKVRGNGGGKKSN